MDTFWKKRERDRQIERKYGIGTEWIRTTTMKRRPQKRVKSEWTRIKKTKNTVKMDKTKNVIERTQSK